MNLSVSATKSQLLGLMLCPKYHVSVEGRGTGKSLRHAKHAVYDQKAERVVFKFEKMNDSIHKELNKLTEKGIHGCYYVTGEEDVLRWF